MGPRQEEEKNPLYVLIRLIPLSSAFSRRGAEQKHLHPSTHKTVCWGQIPSVRRRRSKDGITTLLLS